MILFALLGLINFDGKYVLENVDASKARAITLTYSFEEPCDLHLYFTKGYEFYGLDIRIKDTKGTLKLDLDKAKFIPTRRKPVHVPPTLEGTCRGTIENLKVH